MAAAKKPVSKPAPSSPKKTISTPAAKPAVEVKPVVKAKVVAKHDATVDAKPTTSKVRAKPVAPEPIASNPVALKPATPKPAPAEQSQPAQVQPANRSMKSQESKTAAAKPAAAKKPQAAPTAKPSKKIAGLPHDDVELLAMSDSDYMNPAQLAYFKAKLISMRDEILENARETGEHLKENEVFADPNDRATVEEENLLEQRVRDRERKLLKKINASIIRIDEGEYGYCLETGEPIGLPRLLARPTAELSIEAQEKHERMEKLYAD